jgi:hypothetical protein
VYFLGAVQRRDGRWVKGEPTKVRDLARAWTVRRAMQEGDARDAIILYAETEFQVKRVFDKLTTGLLDKRREEIEVGRGGDRSTPYRYTIPNDWAEASDWLRLRHKFEAGEMGGPDDAGR